MGANHALPSVVILGTRIDNLTMAEVLQRVERMVSFAPPGQIITANVDQLVGNRKKPGMQQLYRSAALVVPDGVPLLWAARFLKAHLHERISGTDLMEQICALACEKGFSIFLFGAPEGVADLAARSLKERFPGLQVAGSYFPFYGFENSPDENKKIRCLLSEKKPTVLFVSLGYPKGVKWITQNQAACRIPLAVEVGSSFMYVSGRMRRAPRWMQKRGLEWFWRLVHEPRRLWQRYLINDLPFFYYLLKQKISRGRTC
ncbi:MAG: WecB/TagA/CpsF family glycosyltransferase [Candidatus Aminicenantes bacterium]|nr:WecB/TagA/CpsF family glycosyltransferase [Candidatus Aminicenantes bacterium]